MPKIKTIGTIALSIFAITFLYQVFSKGFTNQGGLSKKLAEESQAGVRELDKAFADSRAASEALSANSSIPEAKANENSSSRFPQSSCGDKYTGGDDTWYPVFIDGGDLETVRSKFCADAVATQRKNTNVDTVQLASFTSRVKAVEFAQAVSGEVGEPTVTQANSSDEPSQQTSVEVAPSEPTVSEVENQQQQAELQRRQVEQAVIEAKNICHQKYNESSKTTNELNTSVAGYEDNYVKDFAHGIGEVLDDLGRVELQECLAKAQTRQSPTTPE